MPLDIASLTWVVRPVTRDEAIKILRRDGFRCQYCGLDGSASFENALVMGVDFVVPRAKKGRKAEDNLVACCRPCNTLKGRRIFRNFDEAKAHVLKRREEMYNQWKTIAAQDQASATA